MRVRVAFFALAVADTIEKMLTLCRQHLAERKTAKWKPEPGVEEWQQTLGDLLAGPVNKWRDLLLDRSQKWEIRDMADWGNEPYGAAIVERAKEALLLKRKQAQVNGTDLDEDLGNGLKILESMSEMYRKANVQPALFPLDPKEKPSQDAKRSYIPEEAVNPADIAGEAHESPTPRPAWIEAMPDSNLRKIVALAWDEAECAFNKKLWLSCCVMCGSVLEGLLGHALTARAEEAKAKYKEIKNGKEPPPNICGWDLSAMIQVARALDLLRSGDSGRIASTINDYRNLVHPGSDLHKKFEANEGTAQTSLGQVKIIGNDLMRSAKKPEAGK